MMQHDLPDNLDFFGFDDAHLDDAEQIIESDDFKIPETLRQIYALFREEMEPDAALRLLSRYCHNFGGFPVYVPKGRKLESELKKISIWNDFKGNNTEELAKKYNVSLFHVYHVLKIMRKAELEKHQPRLF